MAIYGYTKNYKLIKPQYDSDTWHDYEYDNLDTIDAVLSAIYASGNWKGFWATNTAYVVGDVVIDQDTDTMYKVMFDHTTSEATFAAEQTAHPDYYELWSPNNLAESWAIKTDGKVSNEDYSAKAYAISSGLISEGSAKEWATTASGHATAASTSAEQAATSANSAVSSASSASTSMTNAATSAELSQSWAVSDTLVNDTDYSAKHYANQANTEATNAAHSATNAASSATASANSASASANSAQAAQDALNDVQGLIATPIGTIFQSIYVDESLDIARQLNGQLISSTKFTGFRSWLNTVQTAAPNLFTTEVNWQAEKTNSKLGQCGKFVIDDTAGTIRLPCVVNAQGLVDLALIGGIKSESLPNIRGKFSTNRYDTWETLEQGAFYSTKDNVLIDNGEDASYTTNSLNLDASRSSSTYQDNAPVQQEAVQYPYYIQVATGVEETLPAIREYKTNVPYVLGDSKYFEANPYNASWLESNGQYNASTVYPDLWSQLQVELNSSLNKGDTIEISGKTYVKRGLPVKLSTDTYDDYDFVVNTTDQTFRLPLIAERILVAKKEATTEDSTWFNLYSDGWCEQGGAHTFTNVTTTVQEANVVLLKTMRTYSASICPRSLVGDWGAGSYVIKSTSGTNFLLDAYSFRNAIDTVTIDWQVCGYSAEIPAQSDYTELSGLYYYIGDTVQDASLINAGAVLGQLATKTNSVEAAEASMPSGRYIDLTLGSSGTTYTAPANGWFSLRWWSTASATSYFNLYNTTAGIGMLVVPNQGYAYEQRFFVPAKKGDVISFIYGNIESDSGTHAKHFRFIYAEGDQ